MKKLLFSGLMLFMAAATLSNCSKDETTDSPFHDANAIRASVDETTRTLLNGTAVQWAEGDKILIVNKSAPAQTAGYTLSEGAGTTKATFTCATPLDQGAKWAIYPYAADVQCANNQFTFTLPNTQEYNATSFGNGAFPMVAQSNAEKMLQFKNLCGVIKLQLTGTQTVSKIVMQTAGEKIAGSATVDMGYVGTPILQLDATTGTTALTLQHINCTLTTTPAAFYFVVPEATYAAGLKFIVYDDKNVEIDTKTTAKELIVSRSKNAELTAVSTLKFPDETFRAILVAYGCKLTAEQDIDPADAKLATITELNLANMGITSLQGIEYCTALTTLDCSNNRLTSLNFGSDKVSQGTKQPSMKGDFVEAKAIFNRYLREIDCHGNRLMTLNVSECPLLQWLDCSENRLQYIDVSKNTGLIHFDGFSNHWLSMDVTHNWILKYFDCGGSLLNSLDVRQNRALKTFSCSGNQLTELDVSNNTALTQLLCRGNQLTSLDVSNNTALTELYCEENQLTELDISYNRALQVLFCHNNQLTELDVRNNTALEGLFCHNNQLTSLDVRNNTALNQFDCGRNQLTSLDVSNNTALYQLSCNGNQLTSLDVSNNTALYQLSCNGNQLTSLDVSNNTALTSLHCYQNQLSSLNIQNLGALEIDGLWCGDQYDNFDRPRPMTIYMTTEQYFTGYGTIGEHNERVNRMY